MVNHIKLNGKPCLTPAKGKTWPEMLPPTALFGQFQPEDCLETGRKSESQTSWHFVGDFGSPGPCPEIAELSDACVAVILEDVRQLRHTKCGVCAVCAASRHGSPRLIATKGERMSYFGKKFSLITIFPLSSLETGLQPWDPQLSRAPLSEMTHKCRLGPPHTPSHPRSTSVPILPQSSGLQWNNLISGSLSMSGLLITFASGQDSLTNCAADLRLKI